MIDIPAQAEVKMIRANGAEGEAYLHGLTDAIKSGRAFNRAVVSHIGRALGLPETLLYGLLAIDAITTVSYHLGNP